MEQIAVIGDPQRIQEFQARAGDALSGLTYLVEGTGRSLDLFGQQLLLDLTLDEHPERLQEYAPHTHLTVVGCAVKRSLAEMVHALGGPLGCRLFGLNALPTFIHRDAWEMSRWKEEEDPVLGRFLERIRVTPEWVTDRIGMVVPRVLFMIINEAYFTVQEGTASAADIDLAMKLGTNYPGGPFEWAQRIGHAHIAEVLDNLRRETGESRYKVAPLLRREILNPKP